MVNEIRSGYSSDLFVVEKTFSFVWNYCQWILVVWLITHFTQIDFVLVFVDFRYNPGDAIHRVVVYPPVNSCKCLAPWLCCQPFNSPLYVIIFSAKIGQVIGRNVARAIVQQCPWQTLFDCSIHSAALIGKFPKGQVPSCLPTTRPRELAGYRS